MSADDTYDERLSRKHLEDAMDAIGQPWTPTRGLNVRKVSHVVTVNLDSDGTPLTHLGDRMVQVSPNQWMDPLGAALEALSEWAENAVAVTAADGNWPEWDATASPVPVAASLDPWTVEMLSAIADANEAYKGDDCE